MPQQPKRTSGTNLCGPTRSSPRRLGARTQHDCPLGRRHPPAVVAARQGEQQIHPSLPGDDPGSECLATEQLASSSPALRAPRRSMPQRWTRRASRRPSRRSPAWSRRLIRAASPHPAPVGRGLAVMWRAARGKMDDDDPTTTRRPDDPTTTTDVKTTADADDDNDDRRRRRLREDRRRRRRCEDRRDDDGATTRR